MQVIFKTIAGSRLYGTDNANSDTDYKSVYIPDKKDILLGRVKGVIQESTGDNQSSNSAEDTDNELFSLQRYLELASKMQTVPVEMLFASGQSPLVRYDTRWWELGKNKDKILSRNTNAFVGYCKGQAVKYSLRGTRLDTFQAVVDILSKMASNDTIERFDTQDELNAIEGVTFTLKEQPGGRFLGYLDVYGRQVPETIKVSEALAIYRKPLDEAGQRSKRAQDAGGADWKALYHALRIADEGIELFSTGHITFPCRDRGMLRYVRDGKASMDTVLNLFDEKLEILNSVGDKSPLPEKPDTAWIDDFVMNQHERVVKA